MYQWSKAKVVHQGLRLLSSGWERGFGYLVLLSIDLRMKLDGANPHMNFIPENSFDKQMMKLFLDKEISYVLFEMYYLKFSTILILAP